MKKFSLIVLSVFFLLSVLNGCREQATNKKSSEKQESIILKDVRKSVWNQLSNKEKQNIKGSWKDASFQKIILNKRMGNIKDETFIGKEVYLVDFPSNQNPTLGGIVVYAEIKSHRIIGFGYRD